MNRLIPFVTNNEPRVVHEETLDMLWHEAEQLGQVSVDNGWTSSAYVVKIKFKRKTGTTIWAEGKHSEIKCALAAAINEAREMGA